MDSVRTFTSTPLGPRDRGLEFGEHHRAEVRRTVATYRAFWAGQATRPFDADAWGERAQQSIEDLAPLAAAEIAGIADGAGLATREVAAINARTELLARANPDPRVTECSVAAVVGPGGAFGVQTWDWYRSMSGNWLRWDIPHPDGRQVHVVTEYGVLGKIGVGHHPDGTGVGVLLTLLTHSEDDNDEIGMPVHILSRSLLDIARNVAQARDLCTAAPVSASTSLTVIDDREAVSIEMYPGGPGFVEPDDGLLVRTNHFLTDPAAKGCQIDDTSTSRQRRASLSTTLAAHRPSSPADVLAAMDDHEGGGGVCRHPKPTEAPGLETATLATVTVDPASGSLDVLAGGPCRH